VHAPIARFLPRPGIDPMLLGAVGAAWLLVLVLVALDATAVIEHDAILVGGAIWPVAVIVFIGSWQLMTAVMMLPTSLPMVRAFATTAARQPRPRAAMAAFLAGYFAVWTGFALAALAGDAGLHWLVDRWSWLADRPWLISGGVLVGAGAFQFSPIKERCLAECRSPVQFLWRHYQRGVPGAWRLGLRHGLFCLGCCWALMLIMFAVGVGSLAWMAGLTGVMLIEKTSRFGRRLVPVVGIVLLAWGALVLLRPGSVAAHAGEAHVATPAGDHLIAVALVSLAVGATVYWRRHKGATSEEPIPASRDGR
jgi:predicted metal-binding membrane protein